MSFTQTTINTPAANSVGVTELNLSDGTNGQVLTTNGSGTLSFADGGVAGIVSNADATAITIDSSENVEFVNNIRFTNDKFIYSYNGGATTGEVRAGFKFDGTNEVVSAYTDQLERMRIDSSGNVGIGNTNPAAFNSLGGKQVVIGDGTQTNNLTLYSSTTGGGIGYGHIAFADSNTSSSTAQYAGLIQYYHGDDSMALYTGSTKRMTIDSSGNLLVSASGGELRIMNSTTIAGNIGRTPSSELFLANGNTGLRFIGALSSIVPCDGSGANRDNAIDWGYSSVRFDDIYATNGTIQTSDRNEKQDIEALTDAETRVAVAAKGLLRKFRWQSAVEEKGDEARIHFGIIAQDLQDAFTAEGLDASDYAMFISSTWTDDDGVEQTRLGVRYSELLAFIIAAI
jgi:hypothetical protein